jgi:hypothetical protein
LASIAGPDDAHRTIATAAHKDIILAMRTATTAVSPAASSVIKVSPTTA